MPIRVISALPDPIYRIGRAPDPLAFPPESLRLGAGRFDDPEGQFGVIYAGERRACFVETLARFRRSLPLLASLRDVELLDAPAAPTTDGTVPVQWLSTRRIAAFRAESPNGEWIDLRAPETHEALRSELAGHLHVSGYERYALGDALGQDRGLTQAIASWVFAQGYAGLAYLCRFDPQLTCWALFERTRCVPHSVETISLDDPDLRAVAALFGLTVAADDTHVRRSADHG
jgi:hypothetical protein